MQNPVDLYLAGTSLNLGQGTDYTYMLTKERNYEKRLKIYVSKYIYKLYETMILLFPYRQNRNTPSFIKTAI